MKTMSESQQLHQLIGELNAQLVDLYEEESEAVRRGDTRRFSGVNYARQQLETTLDNLGIARIHRVDAKAS